MYPPAENYVNDPSDYNPLHFKEFLTGICYNPLWGANIILESRMRLYKCGDYVLRFNRTLVMGILNVTPDSFSDGGLYADSSSAVAQALRMVSEGADIVDIGGESTRPGAAPIPEKEELRRVIPIIKKLRRRKKFRVPISIDTMKPEVARAALDAGANILNDVGGFRDEGMIHVAAEFDVPVVVMHMRGTPQTMQKAPRYGDVVQDILSFFKNRIAVLKKSGVKKIILDPGIGFGKKVRHNLEILKNISVFKRLGYPVLIGLSRKSFLGRSLKLDVDNRIYATVAANALLIWNGADIIRVHDVKENLTAVKLADLIRHPGRRKAHGPSGGQKNRIGRNRLLRGSDSL